MTVQRGRDRAAIKDTRQQAAAAPERTCFRCDAVFQLASEDRRVYCAACRTTYGFPAPTLTDSGPAARLALFVASSPEVRSA